MALKDWKKVSDTSGETKWEYIGKKRSNIGAWVFISRRSGGWVWGFNDANQAGFLTKQQAKSFARRYMRSH